MYEWLALTPCFWLVRCVCTDLEVNHCLPANPRWKDLSFKDHVDLIQDLLFQIALVALLLKSV